MGDKIIRPFPRSVTSLSAIKTLLKTTFGTIFVDKGRFRGYNICIKNT